MQLERSQLAFAVAALASGLLFLAAEFWPWGGGLSAYQISRLAFIDLGYAVYQFPLWAGIFTFAWVAVAVFLPRRWNLLGYFCLLVSFNLVFFFLVEVFQSFSSSLWREAGIYFLILAICGNFLGFFLYLTNPPAKPFSFHISDLLSHNPPKEID